MVRSKKLIWDILIPLLCIGFSVALGATITVPLPMRSFNAGELSPLMNARSDYPKYPSGAKTLQNMLVRSQGPIERRPGTKYIAEVKDSTDKCRLIPFEYSTSDTYVLEFGESYFRIFRNGAAVVDGNSNAVEVVTPYDDANDLFELQFVQDAEFMRVVHPDYQPQKITRTSHTAWTCANITFEKGPFQDENDDSTITITPSATTGTITLTGNDAFESSDFAFDSDHVGALWELTHTVEANSVDLTYVLNWAPASNPPSDSLTVQKNRYYDFSTSGSWNGTVRLQRSYDDGSTWEDVTTYTSNHDGNIQYSGQETVADADYRFDLDDDYTVTDRSYCICNLTARAFDIEGVVTIATVVDANEATATVNETLGGTTATYRWSEGYWSDYRGWPRSIEHYEQRCVYGGSTTFPQTIWASQTARTDTDFDDFDDGDADDSDAYVFMLPGMNPIQWLRGQEYLMVGTTAGVGRFGNTDEPTTPTNVEYRMQAHTGSDYIQAVHAVDGILFVERGGQKIREIMYTSSSERYVADDMTVLAEHITGTGVTEIAFQNRPDPILWCVRDDGQLLTFTYHRRHGVEAWARQVTDGSFESVDVIAGTDEDVVYTLVNRTIDSNTVRYVEYFQPLNWTDQNDAWYVDCGDDDCNSLSHLEGELVAILADARPEPADATVSSGVISTSGYTNYVIGLPYTSIYESMPLVVSDQGGTTALRKTSVMQLTIDYYETLGMNVGFDSSNKTAIQFTEDSWATTLDAVTDTVPITFPRGVSRDMTIYIDVNDPVPMCLRGINADLLVTL